MLALERSSVYRPASVPFLYREGSLVVHARNQLVADALGTDAEAWVWIDGDMDFAGHLPLELLAAIEDPSTDVIGVAYPTRTGDGRWVGGAHAEGFVDARGRIRTTRLGFGLVAHHRVALEKLVHALGRYPFEEVTGSHPNQHQGEDVVFSARARTHGLSLYLVADATVGHTGPIRSEGNWGQNAAIISVGLAEAIAQ